MILKLAHFADRIMQSGGLTQRGSGYEDGIYYHNAQEMGVSFAKA